MSPQVAIAAAVVGAAFLALSFPTFGISVLAWTGLVPILMAIRGRSPRMAFGIGWIAGFALYVATLYWVSPTISNFTSVSPVLATGVLLLGSAYVGLYVATFAGVLEWMAAAGISRVVCAPPLWVAIELLRSYFPLPFPWILLGYSQYDVGPVIQLADLGGIYVVSALIVLVNATLTEVAIDGPYRHRLLLGCVGAVVVTALAYGTLRFSAVEGADVVATLRVGVVQGDIEQDEKWDDERQDLILERYLELSREAAEDGAELIAWPEAAAPFSLRYDRRALAIQELANETGARLLVGAPGVEIVGPRKYVNYNRAWMVVPDRGLEGPYDKIRLVPFGEYVPFGSLLAWVDRAVEVIGDFGAGTAYTVFDVPASGASADVGADTVGVSSLICYEGIFPALTRRFVANGARVLVNISNDAWYGRTSAPYQHMAMAAVRAVENRVPVVRATNTGVSAFVDALGRIRLETPLFEPAVAVDDVEILDATSLYRLTGDVFAYLCVGLVVLLGALRVRLGTVLIPEP